MTIGQSLKALRLKKNYKQSYVASQLQITQGFLSKIENDSITHNLEILNRAAEFYNLRQPLNNVIAEQFKSKLNPEVY